MSFSVESGFRVAKIKSLCMLHVAAVYAVDRGEKRRGIKFSDCNCHLAVADLLLQQPPGSVGHYSCSRFASLFRLVLLHPLDSVCSCNKRERNCTNL